MQKNINSLKEYYSKRAKEYEKVYMRKIPVRLSEQRFIADYIGKNLRSLSVLEIACSKKVAHA